LFNSKYHHDEFLLVTELIFCNNPKANEKHIIVLLLREPG